MFEEKAVAPQVELFRLGGRDYRVRVWSFSEWAEVLPEARPRTAFAYEGLGWVDIRSEANESSSR